MRLSDRTAAFPCSPTIAVSEKARRMAAAGADVVALAAGEPELEVAAHIGEAAQAYLARARSPYPPLAGLPALREAIARRLEAHIGVPVPASGVVVTNGAKQAIFNAFLALLNPGDRVLVPTPTWATFMDTVRLAGGTVVECPTEASDRFLIRPAALRARLQGVRGVVFNSPGNPTGTAFSAEEWQGIADVLRESDCFILLDEIYAELAFQPERAPSLLRIAPDLLPRTVVVSGVSKAYAMAGYRLGWAVAEPGLAEAIGNFQSLTTSGVAGLSQEAALAALSGPQLCVGHAKAHYQGRVAWAMQALALVPGLGWAVPDGAFYLFVKVPGDDMAIAHRLLEEAKLAVVPGQAFGMPGYVRLSLAGAEARVRLGVERMVEFFQTQET